MVARKGVRGCANGDLVCDHHLVVINRTVLLK